MKMSHSSLSNIGGRANELSSFMDPDAARKTTHHVAAHIDTSRGLGREGGRT